MTPYEFCNWLRGYLAADPSAASNDILLELARVDMTPFFIPPPPSDAPTGPPSSPPAYSPRDPDGWEAPWYWDFTTQSWRQITNAVAQHYRDQFRLPN